MAQKDDVVVTVSGATFSLLVYENLRCSGAQMGFLLGDVQVFVSKKVTDTDQQVEHEKKHINIDGILPCPKIVPFHDNKGAINVEEINLLLGDSVKRVVGWFKFRQSNQLSSTMREKVIHKELAEYFDCPKELFLMCLLSKYESSQLRLIHSFRHVFLWHKNGALEALPLQIRNLGATSRLEGTDYKSSPKAVEGKIPEPDAFAKLLQKIPKSGQSGYDLTKQIQEKVADRLSELIPEVCIWEDKVHDLEKELMEMKNKMRKNRDDMELDDEPVCRNDSAELFSDTSEAEIKDISVVNSQTKRMLQKDEKNHLVQVPQYSSVLKNDFSRKSWPQSASRGSPSVSNKFDKSFTEETKTKDRL